MQKLPIIKESTGTVSPLDAQQFVQYPVIAINDAVPVERGATAVFRISLLDSVGPVRVHVFVDLAYLAFDETITLTDPTTLIEIPTTGGVGPFPNPEYFEVTVENLDPAYVLRPIGTGTILPFVDYTTYDPGVYEAAPIRTYL